jgi:16S rRNA (guanine966-N2)-methyltransferase
MRERAFAVLGQRIAEARFLDLYSGTGAVGLEALSRGAKSAVFVEQHHSAAALIKENLAAFDLDRSRVELIARSASAALAELRRRNDHFDVAWIDPPFEIWREGLEIVNSLFDLGLLHDRALACLECPQQADVDGAIPHNLEIIRDLVGGASRVVMIGQPGT